jgi:hypothetical protein
LGKIQNYYQYQLLFATDEEICKILNCTLKRENSSYRFIDGKFVLITDKNEIDSIKETLNNNDGDKNAFICRFLYPFRHKESNTNYRNSIK